MHAATRSTTRLVTVAILALFAFTSAHMEMTTPPPRGSKNNPLWPRDQVDFSLTSPLSGPGAFPCQGKPAGKSVATFNAGSSIPVSIGGSAVHGGGHCEFSMQYPGESKFVVLKRVLGDCLIATKDYSIELPASLPSCEGCVFSWSWVNAVGNREYYQNCADINIKGSASGSFTGDEMLVANLAGLGPTIPEFGGSGTDSRQLYQNRPQVTVGRGGNTGGGNDDDVPAPAPAPVTPAPSVPIVTPQPQVPTPQNPTPAPAPGNSTECANGERKCTEEGLLICRRGRFINNGQWCPFNQQRVKA